MADAMKFYGTGRRKKAIARVWVMPGTGNITVNGLCGLQIFFGHRARDGRQKRTNIQHKLSPVVFSLLYHM